ncbi:chromosome segregation protein SMC [Oleomonas cavernae]|uniref:Chromosome segregation protein SMC n=1 Tax=Oleomonas cavernae TaxID=2320859 RepID=A0A418VUG1_9PROT|nr:AAA family ATPase [Oleomonas cavernae]RJF80797.1 chromosome segregation protein SMC [Oleomonas cavernae]
MRLSRLDLTRYGKFTDAYLIFRPPAPGETDFHIVYGPNEAGKSTAFSAWLDLLFGIPQRSRHDFLHPGPTMRIGAAVEFGGRTHALVRVKKSTGSLQDEHGGALPDALLQSGLGGLGREGYEAMFSLDDETLERGGDSILASKGDLGEMLFSASAGLANLSQQLDTLRVEADGFHRPGGRKGPITDAKARLDDLEARRKDLDVQAGAYNRLQAEQQAAHDAWMEASRRHGERSRELALVRKLLALLPLRARLQALKAELAPLAAIPKPPADGEARFQRLLKTQTIARTRKEASEAALARLAGTIDGLVPDPQVLALADRIVAADALRSAHEEAEKDLPRVKAKAEDEQRGIQTALALLGRSGTNPRDLLLDSATVAGLRDLIGRHSGITGQRHSAEAEARNAKALLARREARLAEASPAGDTSALVHLLNRLRQRDPGEALRRAEREIQAADDILAEKMATLLPWSGTAAEVERLPVPAGWQIDAWTSRLETARAGRVDARRAADSLREGIDRQAASLPEGPIAMAISLDDAAAARAVRESLWSAHRRDLRLETADAFETALRRDDQITGLLAQAQADARLQAAARAALDAQRQDLVQAEAAFRKAETTEAAVLTEIDMATSALGLSGRSLIELRGWLEARLLALAALGALRQAARMRDTAARDLEEAVSALRAGLATPGNGLDGLGFDLLAAEAQARIERGATLTSLRDALREAREAVDDRQEALDEARKAETVWTAAWESLLVRTWLAAATRDVAAMNGLLAGLDQLRTAVTSHDSLADRIGKMRANSDAFLGALAAIAAALGTEGAPSWKEVEGRLRRAEKVRDGRQKAEDDQAEARRALAEAQAEIEAIDRELAAMAGHFGLSDPAGLSETLAMGRDAARLRAEITACEKDIAEAAANEDVTQAIALAEADGRPALETREEHLVIEVDQSSQDLQKRYAAVSEFDRRIVAIGGDDAVARLEAERSNILLALEDGARQYLALRLGILLVDKGLRRYRDSHRSEMLNRASRAFSILSRGAYTGLAAQPDDTREVLVALARGGGAKLAPELSKGTRFQLYLALRIAGYHELARSRPPVPFIADDIMETFDDDRSAEAFTLLAEMSRTGQVIYLTHHRHLCGIARGVCPGVQVHELTV